MGEERFAASCEVDVKRYAPDDADRCLVVMSASEELAKTQPTPTKTYIADAIALFK
jgi:hypothetical protein